MQRPLNSPSDFANLFPQEQIGPAASNYFSGFVVNETPREATGTFAETALGVYTAGRHRVRRKQGRRVDQGWSDPGTMNLSPTGLSANWEADGASRAVVVFIRDSLLSRVILENWGADPHNVGIVPRFLIRDPVIESLVTQLAIEAGNGSPSGLLYAESACEFLAYHLIQRHSTLSRPPERSSGGLSARRLKDAKQYIEENLGNPISLTALAQLSCVSVRHFERAFRQSLGVPPHRYVLERRISAARDLLLTHPALTVAQIARKLGFSSSSHLAAAFSRQMGCSPAVFRRQY